MITEPAYYKLAMSLKSGLPNEVDFAFNTLTVLSCDENDPLLLSSVPSLLNLMLAHVGIYDECKFNMVELSGLYVYTKANVDIFCGGPYQYNINVYFNNFHDVVHFLKEY